MDSVVVMDMNEGVEQVGPVRPGRHGWLRRWFVGTAVSLTLGIVLWFPVLGLFQAFVVPGAFLASAFLGLLLGLGQVWALGPHFIMRRQWVVATTVGFALGLPVGLALGIPLLMPVGLPVGLVMIGAVVGALIGLSQWTQLRSLWPDAWLWIPSNAIGLGLGLPLGSPITTAISFSFQRSLPGFLLLDGTLRSLQTAVAWLGIGGMAGVLLGLSTGVCLAYLSKQKPSVSAHWHEE